MKKRKVTEIEPQYFGGDAPGAAKVTITVGNQRVVMPRLTILSILNVAANDCYEEIKKAKSKDDKQYYKELLVSIDTLTDRLKSDARNNPSIVGSWWMR